MKKVTQYEYQKTTLAGMREKRYRTTREITTRGGLTLATGVEVRIIGKREGLVIAVPKCQHCGVSFVCRGVSPYDVEEIKE